jgi:hypothetical protein
VRGQNTGTLTSRQFNLSTHTHLSVVLCRICAQTNSQYLRPAQLKNYVRVVAFAPASRRASFCTIMKVSHFLSTNKLIPLTKLIDCLHSYLYTATLRPKVVISLMAAVARTFMPVANPVWYLRSERNSSACPHSVIYVSAERPRKFMP